MSTLSQTPRKSVEKTESVEISKKAPETVQAAYYGNSPEFYCKAKKYWSEAPATVNGMLGGLGHINTIDVEGSVNFLNGLKNISNNYALDCGAGIGRVSKNLLIPRFKKVDIVEQDENFSNAAKDYCKLKNIDDEVKELNSLQANAEFIGLCEVFNMGLQQFSPNPNKYDLIWSQWVLGHLTDHDLLQFFSRIKLGLTNSGYFVMKENTTSSGKIEVDDADSSVTRPLKVYEKILRDAGYRIVKKTKQQNFPKGLYPVYMIACKPICD